MIQEVYRNFRNFKENLSKIKDILMNVMLNSNLKNSCIYSMSVKEKYFYNNDLDFK